MKECHETITVFNARLDDDNGYDIYVPTVISGVSWYCEIASSVDHSGLKAANKFTLRIPVDADFSGKSYVSPADYARSDPESCFTLNQGDIIVHGEEREALSPAELKEKYGEVVKILGVTDSCRRPNAQHWKVVGT